MKNQLLKKIITQKSKILGRWFKKYFIGKSNLLNNSTTFLSRAKRVTLYLRSSFSMMYPTGPQLNTQGFSELFGGGGGGGGGDFVGWT